ncbi:2S seed storage albumin protein [Lactuca sativa]|uniref:Bifunctional inhibitor/plant lipid transfer protein/seed storage helical domain-containing protein n=1 Tax=Lactuca sativa TaxID=4236 RepID=A0A9R1UYR4_LACSA|nr:2S seed storage albumin protein [Lactuca sativa]KAJ0196460.1 hypothetical protein LSAT_V11C700384750 [Lactuca sativa]
MAIRHAIVAVLLFVISIATLVQASTEVDCPKQIKQQSMQYCHMFLSRIETTTAMKQEEQKPHDSLLQRCCQQLGKLDESCRCMEIREFVRVQQRGTVWDASRMKRLLQEAPNLPKICKLGPTFCKI